MAYKRRNAFDRLEGEMKALGYSAEISRFNARYGGFIQSHATLHNYINTIARKAMSDYKARRMDERDLAKIFEGLKRETELIVSGRRPGAVVKGLRALKRPFSKGKGLSDILSEDMSKAAAVLMIIASLFLMDSGITGYAIYEGAVLGNLFSFFAVILLVWGLILFQK